MPIVGWLCKGCGGREVGLNHFHETLCGETVCHPDFADAIFKDRTSQYVNGVVRVTHGLGCPRRAAIEHVETYRVDPLDANAALTGVAFHALMEHAGHPDMTEVEVKGVIEGIPVNGKIDRMRRLHDGTFIIEDWKHISDFQVKYRKQDGIKPEHIIQASIYAELCQQMGMRRPARGIIWYHTSMNGKDALMPTPFSLMPLAEALAVKPFGGDFTVLELYQQAADVFINHEGWKSLPLAGASILFGSKTMCDYCSVRSICAEAASGAPF